MNSNSTSKPDYTLDFRGAISSIALLEISRIFGEMKSSQVLEIIVYDKDTIADICKVLPKSSYQMNILEEEDSKNRIRVIKTAKNIMQDADKDAKNE